MLWQRRLWALLPLQLVVQHQVTWGQAGAAGQPLWPCVLLPLPQLHGRMPETGQPVSRAACKAAVAQTGSGQVEGDVVQAEAW